MSEVLSDVRLRLLGTRSTLSELQGINTTILKDGALVYVSGQRDVFCLLKESTDTPDGVNIVQSATGSPGRWFAMGISQSAWQTQSDWYVDEQNVSGNASDTNVGDSAAAPLASYAELTRRIQFATLEQDTTVHLLSDVGPTSTLLFRGTIFSPAILTVQGEGTTSLFTGTLTGIQNIVVGSDRPFIQIAGIDWATAGPGGTSLVGERVRITVPAGAAAPGTLFWIEEIDGGDPTIAYISQPYFTAGPNPFGATQTLAIGDQIAVERLTAAGYLEFNCAAARAIIGTNILLKDISGTEDFTRAVLLGASADITVGAIGCALDWFQVAVSRPAFAACKLGATIGSVEFFATSLTGHALACSVQRTTGTGLIRLLGVWQLTSNVSFARRRVIAGTSIDGGLPHTSLRATNAVSHWGWPGSAWTVEEGSQLLLNAQSWGTSTVAGSQGFTIMTGGHADYAAANPPTVNGAGANDFSVGGVSDVYVNLPGAGQNPGNNNAWLVVRA